MSKTKMFGHYLHAMTAHLPTQYELACLRSLNTESQERLFGQARGIAETCTNHHPDNIIPQIMLRLQAKQEQHEVLTSVRKGESQVSHVAKDMPQLPPTKVYLSFVMEREDSWQMHSRRISPFLMAGVDVWWSDMSDGFLFHDSEINSSNPGETFTLLHHRCHSVMDVEERRDACWKRIVDEQIVIPAQSIKLYDSEGNKSGRLLYSNGRATVEHPPTDSSWSLDDQPVFADEGPVEDMSTGEPGSSNTAPLNNPPAPTVTSATSDGSSDCGSSSVSPLPSTSTSYINLHLEQD
jgi:hypothetical protein